MIDIKEFGKNLIFLPDATRGAVRFLTTDQLKDTGTKGVVVNTLHLFIAPGIEKIKELGGIKKIMNWDGYVLSDSGGFQVFSLIHSKKWKGKIEENGVTFKTPIDGKEYILSPESSIDIQMALGSDVLVCLDDCRDAQVSRTEAELSVKRTIAWAERCKRHFEDVYGGFNKTGKYLSAVIQGANFIDLRIECAKALSEMNFDGYNFGGYVINEQGNLVLPEMEAVINNTPDDKFKYAMGVGKPQDIIACSKIGYKVFDTVLVTRNARHGTLYSFDEESNNYQLRISNSRFSSDQSPIDSTCDCEVCKNYSRAYIHYLLKVGEATGYTLASIHNIRFYQRLIDSLQID